MSKVNLKLDVKTIELDSKERKNISNITRTRLSINKSVFDSQLNRFNEFDIKSPLEKAFIESVKIDLANKEALVGEGVSRDYRSIFNHQADTLLPLTKIGMELKGSERLMILSLEDSLDLMLHILCGCDIKAVRSMNNYMEFSRGILTYDASLMYERGLKDLLGLDSRLDDFICSIYKECENSSRPVHESTVVFMQKVIDVASDKLFALAYGIKDRCLLDNIAELKIRSFGLASLVFIVTNKADLELDVALIDSYRINLKVLKSLDYLSIINEPAAICS